ncbi:MAG: hypothetical protein R2873_36375 [Caldilineaceae bacterium]
MITVKGKDHLPAHPTPVEGVSVMTEPIGRLQQVTGLDAKGTAPILLAQFRQSSQAAARVRSST